MRVDVAFVKTGKRDNWVCATRAGEAEVAFPWMAHPGLPHDAIHLVVERVLDLRDGFWGLFASGVDLLTLNDAAMRAQTGVKVADLAGRDTTGLYQAEALVACFTNEMLWGALPGSRRARLADACATWGVPVPPVDAERAERVAIELAELRGRWDALPAGGALALAYDRSP